MTSFQNFLCVLSIGIAVDQVIAEETIGGLACDRIPKAFFCCRSQMAIHCAAHCKQVISEKCSHYLQTTTTTTTTSPAVRSTAWYRLRATTELYPYQTTHNYRIRFPHEKRPHEDYEDVEYKERGWRDYEARREEFESKMAGTATPPTGVLDKRRRLDLGMYKPGELIPGHCGRPPMYVPCVKSVQADKEFHHCCSARRLPFPCRQICFYSAQMHKVKRVVLRSRLCPPRQFRKLLICAAANGADGDSRACCTAKGVPRMCLPFCRANTGDNSTTAIDGYVNNRQLFSSRCFTAMPLILQCHHAMSLHPRKPKDN